MRNLNQEVAGATWSPEEVGLVSCYPFQARSTTKQRSAKQRCYATHKDLFTPENRKGQFPLEMGKPVSPPAHIVLRCLTGAVERGGAVQTNLPARPHSHEHKLSKKEIGCSVKYWHHLPVWKPLIVLTVFRRMQSCWLWPPSLKHLVVARLPHPGHHVNEELDPIGKYGEADQHTYAAIQVPDRRVMLEHFRTQKNGEAHHATHEGVKPICYECSAGQNLPQHKLQHGQDAAKDPT